MRFLSLIFFFYSWVIADSLLVAKFNIPHGDYIAFSLPTNKGRAHFVLKKISNGEWKGKVNKQYRVSGTSDGETFFLYYSLKDRHFFSKIEGGVAKTYSRATLNKFCSTKVNTSQASIAASTEKQLKISILIEKRVQAQIGSKTALWARSVFNSSKAHYESLGISLVLEEILLVNRNFNSSSIDDLLNEIRQARSEFGFSSSSDVVHLIFGTRISPVDTIGLAYLGTVCQFKNYRFGVSRLVSKALQPVLFSHEVGHNLGANHTSSGIMRTVLNNPSTEFSDQSISEIQGYLFEHGGCLKTPIIPNILRLVDSGSRIILRYDTPSCRVTILSAGSKEDQFVKGKELRLASRRISGSGRIRFNVKRTGSNSGRLQALLNCSGSRYRSSAIRVPRQALSF